MTTTAASPLLSRRRVLVGALAFTAAGCDMPRDAEGTLARVRSEGRMQVGATDNPPWVRSSKEAAAGIEPALLRDWGAQLGAEPVWYHGAEAELFTALEERALDVVVAGLLRDNPWSSRIGMTQPYFTARLRLGVRSGTAAPESWEGQRVRVSPHRVSLLAPIRALGAIPVSDDAMAVAIAAYDFELPGLGLEAAGPVLAEEHHVIATAPGESAWLLALDRFLAALDGPPMRRLAAETAAT